MDIIPETLSVIQPTYAPILQMKGRYIALKKSINLIAVLMTAIACALILSACKPKAPPKDTPKLRLELANYSVIRPSDASERLRGGAIDVRAAISALNLKPDISEDWLPEGTSPDDAAYEILVGGTNRPQSQQALDGISSDGAYYVVSVIGNKIVINGTSDDAVLLGVRYFIDVLLPQASGNSLTVDEGFRHVSDKLTELSLVADNKLTHTIVFPQDLDTVAKPGDKNDRTDFIVSKVREIRDMFAEKLDEKPAISDDWLIPGTVSAELPEILVGQVEREEYGQFLSRLAYDEYGYAVIGNKIVIAGWTETDVGLACDLFKKHAAARLVKDGSEGMKLSFLEGTEYVEKIEGRYLDFPAYSGGKLYGLYDAGYQNIEFYYTETTPDEYRAYISKLCGADFTLKAENTIGDNLYSTLVSPKGMLHVYYVAYEKAVRVISCPEGAYSLPAFEPEKVTKLTEPKMTQMSMNYPAGNFGMCYIFTLEDGSFIIIDGGGTTGDDHVKLYKLLQEMNERPDKKIVIAGWLLTHEHWDHFGVFYNFCRTFGSKVTIEGFYCNTTAPSSVYNSGDPNYYVSQQLDEAMKAAGIKTKYVIHSGQKYYIRNAELTCLYTQEDSYPNIIHLFNETSMVTRIVLGGQRIMILGDSNDKASDKMLHRYGNATEKSADGREVGFLSCDIMQVAHHGWNGVRLNLYAKIAAPVAFWPTPAKDYEKMTSGTTSTYYYEADNYIANTLKAHPILADGTVTVTLPFKAGDTETRRG